ncbi:hypothetical protein HDU99_002288, partial [Rhizoclosmatium hyalinum]
MPEDALKLGRDSNGHVLLAGRARVEGGGLQVGKILSEGVLHIGYGGRELRIESDFEVLCGSGNNTQWAHVTDQASSESFANGKVLEAGYEESNEALLVTICSHTDGSLQVGKTRRGWKNCSYGYGGEEKHSIGGYF